MALKSFVNLTPINDTNAHFQAWGSNVSGFFSTAGWVQSLDAGQINWSTVAAPAAVTTVQGYEIWKMNDALQATAPVYLKIEYGSSANVNGPSLWITVAQNYYIAANGTHVPTGIPSTRFQLSANSNGNVSGCWVCGAANNIMLQLWSSNGATQSQMTLSIERTKSNTGVDTADGLLLMFRNPNVGSAQFRQQYWNWTTGPTGIESWNMPFPTANSPIHTGSQLPIFPNYHCKGGVFQNPGLNILGFVYPQLTVDSAVVVHLYGNDHAYIPSVNTFGGTVMTSRSTATVHANCTYMVRWE